jgi:hypothetical protein
MSGQIQTRCVLWVEGHGARRARLHDGAWGCYLCPPGSNGSGAAFSPYGALDV